MLLWRGEEWLKEYKDETAKRLERAAIHLENSIKRELGTKSPPASEPGEYPHLVSGELRRSVTHTIDRDELKARVGTNKIYGRYLEKGTDKMEARPFLERTLEAQRATISNILKGK